MAVEAVFYLLDKPGLDPEAVTRILSARAVDAGFRVSVLTDNLLHSESLDAALWQGQRFLAHHIGDADDPDPVVIGHRADTLRELVINLSAKPVAAFTKLRRVLEIVPNQTGLRERSRQHYRHYRQQGWQLQTHTIS